MIKTADELVEAIIAHLKKNKQEKLLPEVILKLSKIADLENQQGEVITALKIEPGQIRQIEQVLAKKLGKNVKLINKVQKNIIGGMVIRVGDIVIDLSIKSQLKDIKNQVYN